MSYRNSSDIDELFSSLSFVDDAVKNMNFTSLDQDMRDSIQSVFEELDIDPKKKIDKTKTVRQAQNVRYHTAQKKANRVPRFLKNPKGKTAGMLCKIGGIAGTFIFGISTMASLISGLIVGSSDAFVTPAFFMIVSICAMVYGFKTSGLISRFEKYKAIIGDRNYVAISELAAGIDRTKQFVQQDLYKMMAKKYFYNAHIDTKGTTLMLDQATFDQYMSAQNAYYERVADAQQDAGIPEAEANGQQNSPEIEKAMAEGDMYLEAIRHANDMVPDPVISEKLDRLENVIQRIFTVLQQKPDQLPKLRKFMKYYMPTTLKLVQTYQELDAQEVVGENILKSKKEIEGTLDTINIAYEKLLDSFFEEAAMDVSSDISVLQTMLAQEGLTEDTF